jgi:hypothetical protein
MNKGRQGDYREVEYRCGRCSDRFCVGELAVDSAGDEKQRMLAALAELAERQCREHVVTHACMDGGAGVAVLFGLTPRKTRPC